MTYMQATGEGNSQYPEGFYDNASVRRNLLNVTRLSMRNEEEHLGKGHNFDDHTLYCDRKIKSTDIIIAFNNILQSSLAHKKKTYTYRLRFTTLWHNK